MQEQHYKLWGVCRDFVGDVCADRDASHGLFHMETVTKNAILIFLMNHSGDLDAAALSSGLLRVVAVAMLHDVNDHKYDKDGTLGAKVRAFVASIVSLLAVPESELSSDDFVVETFMTTLAAISYSKENARGMRWFVDVLPSSLWVCVRDAVSDADKLEAIGEYGLLRCYDFQMHMMKDNGTWDDAVAAHGLAHIGREVLLPQVLQHADEKLLRLKDQYIVSRAGKFLAEPLHSDMIAVLAKWSAEGPPALTAA